MITQYISLLISVVVVFSLMILIIYRKRARHFYLSFILSFLAEVAYYVYILFCSPDLSRDNGVMLSSMLRMFQTIMFGGPFFFEMLEELYTKYKMLRLMRKLRLTKEKLKNITEAEESGNG